MNNDKQTLFCPNIPGAGRTVLTSIIVDYLETSSEHSTGIGIAHLYCSFQQQQRSLDLVTSLLKQLTQRRTYIPRAIKSLHERYACRASRPLPDETLAVLRSVVAFEYSKVFIVMDALDECHISDGSCTGLSIPSS